MGEKPVSDLNSGNDNKTGQHSPDKDLSVWKERLWGVVAGVIATVLCSSIVLIKNHLDEQKYKIGNTIYLGRYEQNYPETNEPDPIEWYIISQNDGCYLLMSRYILEAGSYNNVREAVSWEKCSLRAWLNGEFLNSAFSGSERRKIVSVNNTNPDNTVHNTSGGNATHDSVFLLSAEEAKQYLTNETAFGLSTDYAFFRGARVTNPFGLQKKDEKYMAAHTVTSSDGHEFEFTHLLTKECFWLLRTPGSSQEKVCRIYNSSYSDFYSGVGAFIDTDGVVVDGTLGIRPALWYKP